MSEGSLLPRLYLPVELTLGTAKTNVNYVWSTLWWSRSVLNLNIRIYGGSISQATVGGVEL
ncbi:hypothetical protein J6590_056666 [Homalodisca vitripennis]|nr:hypothetical protein J6590_056666 [Homalodisca vitripennis]